MKRITLLLTAMLLMCLSAVARTQLSGAEAESVAARINAAASKIKSMECTFQQKKSLSIMRDEMKSQGRMWYSAPACLRWEYTSPYTYAFVMNGDRVKTVNSRGSKTIDLNTSKLFRSIANIMMQTVTGKCLGKGSDFTAVIYQEKDTWECVLTPRRKNLRAMFASVTLTVSRSKEMVTAITMREAGGDVTVITFGDTRINTKIPASVFAM